MCSTTGRKFGIIFATLIFSAGVAMQTAATAIPLFVAGRCIAGLGVGLISVMVPMYRSHSMDHMHHMPMPVHPPHPVQLTDDAASKETQYLRRRCTNCSQTEPPSWRRSTLNPGKIVCNKCGLYERTHLRPRPLRFDELRNGNKARKAAKKGGIVKAEAVEASMPSIVRRASMSSQHSSDWDDSRTYESSES